MALFKLGLKPPRRDSIAMLFGTYFKPVELPAVPHVFGRPWLVRNWQLYGNDQYGDCYWAGAAHESMMLCADAAVNVPMFTTRSVLDDYAQATGFDAKHAEDTDLGTDMQVGCAYRQKTGIHDQLGHRHKIDIYTALKPGDLTQLALAVYLFGIGGVGVQLPDTAETQFSYAEVWTVKNGASIVGGHYIPCVGRNRVGNYLFLTWGRLQAATPEWVMEYMDQGAAFVSRERLKASGLSPQGFNLAQLEDDYHQLTGA